jgi:hypothetical protein
MDSLKHCAKKTATALQVAALLRKSTELVIELKRQEIDSPTQDTVRMPMAQVATFHLGSKAECHLNRCT